MTAGSARQAIAMAHSRTGWLPVLSASILLAASPSFAHEATEVDLALVLAVDASSSMDEEEQSLQRRGYVEAFRSPMVHDAIRRGNLGRIAVVYVDWSDASDQRIVVPWTVIGNREQAMVFAGALEGKPTRRTYGGTSISGALAFSRRLLMSAPFEAARNAIDISGDGKNNHGPSVAQARGAVLLQGIAINGLPLLLNKPERSPDPWNEVERYYRDCVIGGVGAFEIPAFTISQFADAIRLKLIREIAAPSPAAYDMPAFATPAVDCREEVGNGSMR
jgi:Protein of unknown function (DUF1194)